MLLGCLAFVVTVGGFVAADPGQAALVRWAAYAIVALCLVLGTILRLNDRI